MSHDQVGIREGKDSDGDRCWYGWGFSFGMTGVRWTHDINSPDHLHNTREEAQERLASIYDQDAEEIELKAKLLTEAAAKLREGAKSIRNGGGSEISPMIAEHGALRKAEEEMAFLRKKRQLERQLAEHNESRKS